MYTEFCRLPCRELCLLLRGSIVISQAFTNAKYTELAETLGIAAKGFYQKLCTGTAGEWSFRKADADPIVTIAQAAH